MITEEKTELMEDSKNQKYNDVLVEQIKKLFESNSIDQTTLANRIGYSNATISLYLKKSYPGNVQNIEKALSKYLVLHNSVQEHQKVTLQYTNTSVASSFFAVAKMCRLNSEICLCYGSSGIGKTTAIKQFASENSGVVLIDPDEGATIRSVLLQLVEKLSLSPTTTKSEDLTSAITRKLTNSGFLVIVDEAENVKTEVVRTLRKIHDRCESTFGLLFVGTETLYQNLKRLRSEYNYVMNRVGYVTSLHPLDKADIELLVKQVFPDCSDECLLSFESACDKNARILFNTLKRAKDIQISTKDTLNPKMIASARRMLLI